MTDRPLSADEQARQDVRRVHEMIRALPGPAQRRAKVVAQILRDLLVADQSGETELAFTLIMAELACGK